MQGGEAAMVELLGRNLQLTAVFAYNDSMAAGALTALKDNGIAVPQHLSLIGFDDIPIARYTDPQLTTVRYPIASMAKLATELALQGRQGCWIRGNTLFHADFSASPLRRGPANCGSDH
jgi:LacI family transcriptional regulator